MARIRSECSLQKWPLGFRGACLLYTSTSAFAIAPAYTFGDAGRNILSGPGFGSVDVSLYRLFNLNERFKLSAEVQAFNVFNRANFDLPQNYADNPATFGRIFSANAPRQLQLSARLAF